MHLFWVVFCTKFTFKKNHWFIVSFASLSKVFFLFVFQWKSKKFLFAISFLVTPAKKITLKTVTYLKIILFSTILPVLGTAFVHTLYFQLFKEKLKHSLFCIILRMDNPYAGRPIITYRDLDAPRDYDEF